MNACLLKNFGSSQSSEDPVADLLKAAGHIDDVLFVLIPDGDDHVLVFRKVDACSKEGLVESLVEGLCDTQTLTGGFHLRSKADICAADLLKGEYRHLDGDVICFLLKSRCVAKLLDLLAQDHFRCQRNDGDTGYLADVGNRTAGTRIYLDDVNILAADDKLDVDQSDDMKGSRQLRGVIRDGGFYLIVDARCRINGDTVSGMDTGALDVLHDTRDQDVLTVADRVDLDLLTHQVFIYQDRMFLGDNG